MIVITEPIPYVPLAVVEVTAVTADQVVMAIEDPAAGRWAVQFHPESILTAAGSVGHQVVGNVLRLCRAGTARQLVT